MKKPVIGISGSLIVDDAGSFAGYKRSYVNNDYILSVIRNGGIPFIIPFNENEEVIKAQMEMIDGLLLSGGQDVAPKNYGEEPTPKLGDIFPERDDFEYGLLKSALEAKKPVLGICRGSQIINTYFNGSLYQDLSYIGKDVLKHNQVNSPSMVTHSVTIDKSSKLFDIFGEEKIMVNSFHHQAVKKVGEGLVKTAKAPDGIVEAIEKTDYPFLVAVQWHPEMLHNSVDMMNKLFLRFIKEASNE